MQTEPNEKNAEMRDAELDEELAGMPKILSNTYGSVVSSPYCFT